MENAGRAATEEVVRRFPRGSRVAVLCGPGNNGGDGFVCARYLRERGYQVRLALHARKEDLKRDPKEMARRWDEAIEPFSPKCLEGAQVIVDAIYGTGLHEAVTGVVAQVIEEVTARALPVVAIDVPTGIDATSGTVHGVAFKAASTITFFRRKTGHVLLPGRLYCGDVRAADIGIPASVIEQIQPGSFTNDPDFWLRFFPKLKVDDHKYDRGHAVVVSGPMERTGAARIAARTALRAGAGLVSVATSKSAFYINASQLSAIMVDAYDGHEGLSEILSDTRITSVLIGPGAGQDPEVKDLVASRAWQPGHRGHRRGRAHRLQRGARRAVRADQGTPARAYHPDAPRRRVQKGVSGARRRAVEAGARAPRGRAFGRGHHSQGAGHRGRAPRRPCRHQRKCAGMARHGWQRRCAGGAW